jgi:hypothetical protein
MVNSAGPSKPQMLGEMALPLGIRHRFSSVLVRRAAQLSRVLSNPGAQLL